MTAVIRPRWLVIIEIADERVRGRQRVDHLHAWFPDEDEARFMARRTSEQLGIPMPIVVDNAISSACPLCGHLALSSRA